MFESWNRKKVQMIYGLISLSLILAVIVLLFIQPGEYSHAQKQFSTNNLQQGRTYELSNGLPQASKNEFLTDNNQQIEFQTVVDKLNLLNEKAKALHKPGWLHIVTVNSGDNDLENHGEINGVILPLDYTQESWLLFDSQGRVVESVTIQRADDGRLIQASVHKDGLYWNTMTGEITEEAPDVSGDGYQSYIFNILQEVLRPSEYHKLDLQPVEFEGREALRLIITYENSEPIQTLDYRQPTIEAEKMLFIDPNTGHPIREQMIMTLADGSQRVFYRVDFVQFEVVDAPSAEAIKYLIELEEK